jgi:prepilin-type N-terminal cleavage/methylation domain-containing protein
MTRRPRAQSGMTLLEVVISITLVSLLSLGLLYAMSTGLGAMASVNRRIEAGRRAVGAERIMQMQFSGFLPVMARCGAAAGATPAPTPFFQGEPAVLRFVTTYSLFEGARGNAHIVEYFLSGRPEGGLRLLVNEIPYRGPVGAGLFCGPPASPGPGLPPLPLFAPPQPTPVSFVLADQLRAAQFSYLSEMPEPVREQWLPRWVKAAELPRAIRIDMIALDPQSARLPSVAFVAPIRVTRPPGEPHEY